MSVVARTLALALAALAPLASAAEQTEADGYTRYELLDPASHKFRIVYDVSATTPGATRYFNPIRPGSTASNEHVSDRATGQPLAFAEVGAAEAMAGGIPNAKPDSRWIAVTLARPVPADGGEGRIRIDKTYEDARSYFRDGDVIVFKRDLGIKRNAVLLPPGYRLITSNVPSQLLQQPDGRLLVSFWNSMPSAATLEIRAAPMAGAPVIAPPAAIDERAAQSREIVYYLRDPASHSFELTHDYTETRAGIGHYLNIVRAGSRVSAPSGRDLDTGAALGVQLLTGAAAIRAYEPEATDLNDSSSAVLFTYPPLAAGTSKRLRIRETYTDAGRYGLNNGALVWQRSLGRPANAVVLPAGWTPTNISVPATVSRDADGRTRIELINPRQDAIDVTITAVRDGVR